MIRYIARPPVAIDRLNKPDDGLITYRLKKKYRDGTERLLFSPMELMEKLAALVPKPRGHVTRYHGLFAPHSKNRHKIVLQKPKLQSEPGTENEAGQKEEKSDSRMSWAKLLNRVFEVDITECNFCCLLPLPPPHFLTNHRFEGFKSLTRSPDLYQRGAVSHQSLKTDVHLK